jgi:hypothetical protein
MDRRFGSDRRQVPRIDQDRRSGDDRRQNKKVIHLNDRRGKKETTGFHY